MTAGNWSFGLITPDGLLTGSFDAIATRLAAHGLDIVAGCLLQLDLRRMHQMYRHTDDPPPPTGSEELPPSVMNQLYVHAPALVIVVTGPAGVTSTLLGAKGDKRPVVAGPDTVRRGGEHLIFNFLHSPDDAESAVVELAYLVGRPEAEGLMGLAGSGGRQTAPLIGPAALRESIPSFGGWDVLSFPLVVNRIRRRVVHRLTILGRDDPACLRFLFAAQLALDDERHALVGSPDAADRLRVAALAGPSIHGALIAADDRMGTGLGGGLAAIAGLFQAHGSRELAAVHALTDQSIYLSPLEKLAIEGHRHALRADEPAAYLSPGSEA